MTDHISSDLLFIMENETKKSVAFKVTLPAEVYKDFEIMRGSTTNSTLVLDLYRYAVHQGFNPNNVQLTKEVE